MQLQLWDPLPHTTKLHLSGPPHQAPTAGLSRRNPFPYQATGTLSSPWAGSVSKTEGVEEGQIFGMRRPGQGAEGRVHLPPRTKLRHSSLP